MKVIDALKKGEPTLSFEFFPPKTEKQEAELFDVIGRLKQFAPDFVSVTCGAMGTTREKTFFWAKELKQKFKIEPVAHLTCVAADRQSILDQAGELERIGVENILALRGDPPQGETAFMPPEDGFRHAKELVALLRSKKAGFCVGVAGYPEGHPESADLAIDTEYLKEKIDAGAEFIITQLFFDNRCYFDFVDRCKKAGIHVPIIAGIMPVTSYKQIHKMVDICGASIPEPLRIKLEKNKDDHTAIRKIGVEQAISQCEELLEAKVPGIHFFVMNQDGPIAEVLKQLKFSRPR